MPWTVTILALGLLLQTGPASADIVPTGSDAFKAEVAAAIAAIKAAKPELKAGIEKLENSSNRHVITERKGKSECTAHNKKKAKNGEGSGSNTGWNNTSTKAYAMDVQRDPVAVLAHELAHACHIDQGTATDAVDDSSKIEEEEIAAVATENTYRTSTGLPLRRKYGQKPLPQTPQLCEVCVKGGECDGECLPVEMCAPFGDTCQCIQFTPGPTPGCAPLQFGSEPQLRCLGTCPAGTPICRNVQVDPEGPLECLCKAF